MRYLTIKNFDSFQHYKDRDPPWIKMHRSLLDDYEFAALPDAAKSHLMLIWLLAAKMGGRVPADARFIAGKIGASEPIDLDLLISTGFLVPEQDVSPAGQAASNLLAACKHGASEVLALAGARAPSREVEGEREVEEETHSPAIACGAGPVGEQEQEQPLPTPPDLSAPPDPPKRRRAGGKVTMRQWLDDCRQRDVAAIEEDDPIHAWAEGVGLQDGMVAAAWHVFKERHLDAKGKVYTDWPAAFRNAVRGDWYRLWYLREGERAKWTTAGEGVRRAMGLSA